MSDELALIPQDFSNLTPEQILQLLDSGWPWPLDAVQEWFEDLWDMILEYFYKVVDWVRDKVKPLIDRVWYWVQSSVEWLWSRINSVFDSVWEWIQSSADWLWSNIEDAFDVIWDWLKSVRDWLWTRIEDAFDSITLWVKSQITWLWGLVNTAFGKVWDWIKVEVAGLWALIQPTLDWMGKVLAAIPGALAAVPGLVLAGLSDIADKLWDIITGWLEKDAEETEKLLEEAEKTGELPSGSPWLFAVIRALLLGARYLLVWMVRAIPRLGPWLIRVTPALARWLGLAFGLVFSPIIGPIKWLIGQVGVQLIPFLGVSLIGGLALAGKLDEAIEKTITPAVSSIFEWFEKQGPVAPQSGSDMSVAITKLATITVTGLTAMTVGGELLSPLKQVGLGQVSAMIYDLINYRTLTAAFMGVLAAVYIRTPLTYYYNKVARPNIPSERDLISLAGEYAISKKQYQEAMQYHGYPDEWIAALYELADRPFSPFLIRYLADAGELDEELLDRELHNARYNEKSIPALKDAFRRLAAGELKTLMISVAIKRYREGLDDQDTLKNNLLALGTHPQLINKYLFGAELDAVTDYQLDLLAYYKDAYHRREINDTQFLEALDSLPLDPSRSQLIYNGEKIKRLKVASTPAPVVKTLTAAQVGMLYKRNKLTKEDAIARLGTYLPIATDRTLFLSLYEPGEPEVTGA